MHGDGSKGIDILTHWPNIYWFHNIMTNISICTFFFEQCLWQLLKLFLLNVPEPNKHIIIANLFQSFYDISQQTLHFQDIVCASPKERGCMATVTEHFPCMKTIDNYVL